MHRLTKISSAAALAIGASALWAGLAFAQNNNYNNGPQPDHTTPPTYTVTINKYLNGALATASSTNSASFPMTSAWNDKSAGSGSGTYALGPTGFNSSTPYQAVTSAMSRGSSYTTSEDTTGSLVGATCSAGDPYALAGYTTGSTSAAAAAGTASLTAPSFSDLDQNEFVDVWNVSCPPVVATSTLAAPTNTSPTNGEVLTSADFTSASWSAVNDAAGGITYVYQAANSAATNADGSFTDPVYTSPALSTTSIATADTAQGTYFWHVQATDASGTASTWSPTTSFTINNNASSTTGTSGGIGGTVSTSSQGVLSVTSIQPIKTNAIADNSFLDGWEYVFNITVPSDEPNVTMQFSDWLGSMASDTIPVAGNMQISSQQADNGDAPITLTAADAYSAPLHITGDLDPTEAGDQIQVEVDVKIPDGTASDSYLTNYAVQSNP